MRYAGYLAMGLLTAWAACRSVPKADTAIVAAAQSSLPAETGDLYRADPTVTTIEWIGASPISRHHGTFGIREGVLRVVDGAITTGRFEIDMNTLQADDQDSVNDMRLGNHLKSNDFFDVDVYPSAAFVITSVQPAKEKLRLADATHLVTGNLLLKETTKSISFPARIVMNQNRVIADAVFNMDRGEWGINYANDRSLKNKAIRPMVQVQVHLEAGR